MAFNVYNDNLALQGLLENASAYFEDVVAVHAGPSGRRSTDGTIETLERWGIRTVFASIDDGFGVVRTRLIRESKTDWVMIMDCDERFYPNAPILRCEGDEAYPAIADPKLTVIQDGSYNQGQLLKDIITQPEIRAVKAIRRHWFKPGFTKPCQNWMKIPDYQLRIVKNAPEIRYDPNVRMHEKIQDGANGNGEPKCSMWNADDPKGIFYDHLHCFFKAQEPAQRQEDIKIFDAIHFGKQAETWKELGYA